MVPFIISGSNAISNGAGGNSSLKTRIPPTFNYYNVDGGTSSKVNAATVTFSTTGTFNVYTLSGAIDTFGDCLYLLQF